MSLETRIRDLAQAIGLEIKSIRETVDYHNDSDISPATALDGDEIVIVSGKLVAKPRPIIIESPDGVWKTTTNDFDTPITDPVAANTNVALSIDADFREIGFWKPKINFLYSADSAGADFEATCTVDGQAVAKCQPTTQEIIKEEGKDAAGSNPDNPNAGTAQIKSYGMEFHAFEITSTGNKPVLLLFGPEQGGVEANIAEITIEFHRVYNIQKST